MLGKVVSLVYVFVVVMQRGNIFRSVVVMKMYNVLVVFNNILVKVCIVFIYLFVVVKVVFIGNINKVWIVMQVFYVIIKISLLVIVVIVVVVLIYKLVFYCREFMVMEKVEWSLYWVWVQVVDIVVIEIWELNIFLGIVCNEKISKEQWMEVIKRFNVLSEEYFGGFRLEIINIREVMVVVKDYMDNLLFMVRICLVNLRLEEIQKEKRVLEE